MQLGEQQRQNQRQDRLDADAAAGLARTRQREDRTDQLRALDQQGQMLGAEAAGLAGGAPDEATQADFTRRAKAYGDARGKLLSSVSGYDFNKERALGIEGIKKLKANDMQGLQPGDFTRTVTVATGRPPSDYVRQGDQPAVVEQAGHDFINGMGTGDQGLMLKGINTMFAPELRSGVGTPGKHGTIVGKQIVSLDHAPGGDPNDPHVVPRIRVYINDGKGFRGPVPEGTPEGATGYYDAPLTKDRSSHPDDKVRPIGVQEALDYMQKQGEMVELMNHPEALQRIGSDAQAATFNPQDYLNALASMGAAGGKKTTKDVAVPAGGSVLRTTYDSKGNAIKDERIEGNAKPASTGSNQMQGKIDAIRRLATEEGGNILTEAEANAKIKRLTEKETEPKPARSGSGGGGSGGGGGAAGKIHKTEKDGEGFLIGVFKDGGTRRLLIDGKPVRSQDFEKRVDKAAHDMSQGIGGLGKSAEKVREEARNALLKTAEPEEKNGTPKKLDKLPDGAKQIGTAGGKPVYEVTNPDGTKRRFKGE